MVEMNVVYTGQLHCELKHGPSGTLIQTDAPKDNQGKGEAFSPTDLVGAALASCVLTTMAIGAEREGISFGNASAKVTKEMNANPRRIARLPLEVTMPKGLDSEARRRLEAFGRACPVAKSLHPDVEHEIKFVYVD